MKNKISKNELVISSKVTLDRNLADFLFTPVLDFETSEIIVDEIVELFTKKKNYKVIDIDVASENYLNYLKAEHLISNTYIDNCLRKKIIVRNDRKVCIMINGENHVEITSIIEGDNIEKAYNDCYQISNIIEKNFCIAFNDKLGYLTTKIATAGLGMKASYLLHIPLLDVSGQINDLNLFIAKVGYTLEPIYNQESNTNGGLFILKATHTCGLTVEELFENLSRITYKITDREETIRNHMIMKEKERVEDEIHRAYGILTNARLISEKEAVILLSYLKIGLQLNLIDYKNLENKEPLEILHSSMDGIINYGTSKKLTGLEIDIKRANYIREKLLI